MKRQRKYWFWSRKGKTTKMCLLCCYGKIWRLHVPEAVCPFFSKHYFSIEARLRCFVSAASSLKPSINQAFNLFSIPSADVWLFPPRVLSVRSMSFKKLYGVLQDSFDYIMWRQRFKSLAWFRVCVCLYDDWLARVEQTQQNVREHLNPPCWRGKKRTVLFSWAWEPFPSLETLIQPLWTLGTIPLTTLSPTGFALCVSTRACSNIATAPFPKGRWSPSRAAVEGRKHCEEFSFHSCWQEGKGWEHQQAWVLSPSHCFNVGEGAAGGSKTTWQRQHLCTYHIWAAF